MRSAPSRTRSATSPTCWRARASDEAAAAVEQALERYVRKKNVAMVAQVRRKLEALRTAAPA